MDILLDKWRKVDDVQAEFNGAYPYLMLCFVNNERKPLTSATKTTLATKDFITIGDLNPNLKPCTIEVDSLMAVSDLEKQVSACINMPVKILRKSGNVWLETSITNHWTLAMQNEHAREISTIHAH